VLSWFSQRAGAAQNRHYWLSHSETDHPLTDPTPSRVTGRISCTKDAQIRMACSLDRRRRGRRKYCFLAGCAADGSLEKSSHPFGKSAREESAGKQVESDSFPTAQQAGL